LVVELVDLIFAVLEHLLDVVLVFDNSLTELRDLVVFVLVEGAEDTDAGFARLTVEANHFTLVVMTFNILLYLHVENAVIGCDLGLTMKVDALLAQQLGTIQTLGLSFLVLPVHQLAEITEWKLGWLLSCDNLRQTGHQEVIRKLFNATYGQLGALATQGACELSIVAVLLVGGL